MKNDKYRMNGVVTEAYGNYEHLVGHRVHMSGIITWDPSGDPENAPGSFRVKKQHTVVSPVSTPFFIKS